MTLDHLAFTFSRAVVELEEATASKRPIGALMRSKWIDGNFVGDCETLLSLFRSELDRRMGKKDRRVLFGCL